MESIQFLTIGSPLLDVTSNVDKEFLLKYKLKSNSTKLNNVETEDLFKELKNCTFNAGGTSANTARIVQWLVKKPKTSFFIGAIGTDEFGRLFKEELKKSGVECLLQEYANLPTGKCAVLINGHNRSLCTDLGASKLLNFDSNIWEWIKNARCIYVPAFLLNISQRHTLEIARYSSENNIKFTFNVGAPFLCQAFPNDFVNILQYVDVLFGNENEIKALASIFQLEGDLNEILLKINNLPKANEFKRITIMTRGPESIIYVNCNEIKEFLVPKMKSIEIIDTNAAGDAFAGGYLSQFIQNRTIIDCLKCGVWMSQEIIKNTGCTFDFNNINNNIF